MRKQILFAKFYANGSTCPLPYPNMIRVKIDLPDSVPEAPEPVDEGLELPERLELHVVLVDEHRT